MNKNNLTKYYNRDGSEKVLRYNYTAVKRRRFYSKVMTCFKIKSYRKLTAIIVFEINLKIILFFRFKYGLKNNKEKIPRLYQTVLSAIPTNSSTLKCSIHYNIQLMQKSFPKSMYEQVASTQKNLPKVPILSIQFNPFDPPVSNTRFFFTCIKHDRRSLNDTNVKYERLAINLPCAIWEAIYLNCRNQTLLNSSSTLHTSYALKTPAFISYNKRSCQE
ncbi:hypothetical protein PHYBLDRAFT_67848 [Phycomyces blakesleeanus NRRL 1555(-)]|uniref:Uncharacterized protein n=1 Tax=Phycomyces blakesleeanus (strain ATCC 8743b / DSM 1359 / FGSC 10004 / NBRC 33097 / NRRL 1555) TaxID=763407 RepID=A0A162XIF0_PHYB8|nr:hypothetical protein PHYBLDRAFT_67848 [Phycomyces blakesleeanus NRRL 1555(-)]OAD75085.1 hypothetical protein PHYBLDRAFT_67848 [Phycomyces blakesleeanus NRRL 1555(-)]|eukprot:XP_018293125.1 hypothetical protein PHYBLDRAFT_67848 [Phycomyces blakesleeanus NRRL 1555(-)]